MSYNRRIVCDVDDTISQTFNRDWENAQPIQEVIDKINFLYDQGWEIFLVTARGQLSCNGDSQAADRKYRKVVEDWLHRHNVKYHQLSFNKPLATYYVDDKGLSPKDFLELKVKNITSGWSGAIVEQRGERVYKTHRDSLLAAEWYSVASKFFNVPKVYSVIGDTICMEYIHSSCHLNFDEVVKIISKMKSLPPYKNGTFSSYINRVSGHCEYNAEFEFIIPHLKRIAGFCEGASTFSHGDLSHENIIPTDRGHFLIDPILKPDNFSSYLLDVTKFLYSLKRDGMAYEYNYFKRLYSSVPIYILDVLEATQWVRVYKYAPDSIKPFIYNNIINYDTHLRESQKRREDSGLHC